MILNMNPYHSGGGVMMVVVVVVTPERCYDFIIAHNVDLLNICVMLCT